MQPPSPGPVQITRDVFRPRTLRGCRHRFSGKVWRCGSSFDTLSAPAVGRGGAASRPGTARGAWEAGRSVRALARMSRQKYRFDEGRMLRAKGASTCAGLRLAIDEFPFCTRRAAAATTACWSGRVFGHRPSPTGRCSPVSPRPHPREDPSRPASFRSRRRFGSPAERASRCDGTGRIMRVVFPAAGR